MFLRFRLLLSELSKFQQTLLRTKQLHALILKLRLSDDPFYATKIVRFYGMSGDFDYVCKVFDGCHHKSVFLWNSIIRAYARARRFNEAFSMFSGMLRGETRPDSFSYACVIRACCESSDVNRLRLFHGGVIVSGLGMDPTCNSALVMAYSKLGLVEEAGRAFSVISEPDLVMWNSMISGYSCCGLSVCSLKMFVEMQRLGESPDGYTLVGLISGLAGPDSIRTGEGVHGFCLKSSFESNPHVGSCLVNMYARFKCMDSAQKVFAGLINLDLVSWSALITGYCQCGEYEKASYFFRKMMGTIKGRKVDPILIASVLAAAAQSANIGMGIELHGSVLRCGLESDVMISSALIDMYAKCGLLGSARRIFENMPKKNAVSYNTIIQGLGLYGLASESFRMFDEMLNAGLEPDSCTFSALLCACCHSGLLNDGRELFTRMEDEFHVRPKVEHYVYLVKLLGMAGEFEEAYQLIDSSPGPVDPGIWGALLSCCEVQGNSEMAEVAARKLFETGAEKGAYRVMLSKVYARDGRWSNVNELRDEMTDAGLRKMPGLSWIGGTGTYS
ncbi:putative pentatricopeptide repeat-containing protein At1g64310 [Punica granatum]|uniref:Pentatricopeptide repeat-containing protein At1g64310 n=1 Tax=Punica granatum TaxID=22663 RepID=A0A6P8BNY6_PUNGR|nr:putative pentatricopeptide repeat-containing protein At1g64310 [Punica granatum]